MKKLILPLLLVALVGCAKLPDSGSAVRTTRLVFTMTLAREVNPNFIYFVALRPALERNPPELGPKPVIAPPWGNGFVAGDVSHFVRWSADQAPRYQLYVFRDVNLLDFRPIAVPVFYEDVAVGGKTLRFELDLLQISESVDQANLWQSLQVNFLTMDRVPSGSTGSKTWDALGDGRLPSQINLPITVPLKTSGTYNNSTVVDREPSGDTADPDIDIVDWSIEVRP